MSTYQTDLPPRSQQLFQELAQALTKARGSGKQVGEFTYHLLAADTAASRLLGVRADGEAAYRMDVTRRQVMRVPVAEPRAGRKVRREEYVRQPYKDEEWIREKDPEVWAWVHPRYRWLVDPD